MQFTTAPWGDIQTEIASFYLPFQDRELQNLARIKQNSEPRQPCPFNFIEVVVQHVSLTNFTDTTVL